MVGSEPIDFHLTDRRGAYDFVTRTLRRLNYAGLSKADKGVVRCFVAKVTGLSRAQSTRLIGQYRNTGHIRDRRCGATRPFERRYTAADIRLLAEVDETLGGLCGPTTRRVMRRQYEAFGDERFERLAGLSNSHLYRIRQSTTYRRRRNPTTKTQSALASGANPTPRPGFLRVDSVHQGDLDGRKGVYEVNLVDEVTQYEFVAAVEGIPSAFWSPLSKRSLRRFPSRSRGFTPTTAPNTSTTGWPDYFASYTWRSSPTRRSNALVESDVAAAIEPEWLPARRAGAPNYHRPCPSPSKPPQGTATPSRYVEARSSMEPGVVSSSSTVAVARRSRRGTRPATNCFALRRGHRAESSGRTHDKGRILWICGRTA